MDHAANSQPKLLHVPPPLMTIAPHHSLSVVYMRADTIEPLGAVRDALSGLTEHALQVSDPECQAKRDAYCRMVIQAS